MKASTGLICYVALIHFLNGVATPDSKVHSFVPEQEQECDGLAIAFSKKHQIPYSEIEPCRCIEAKAFQVLIDHPATYLTGPDTSIISGYYCKKNRRGKLYACRTIKERK